MHFTGLPHCVDRDPGLRPGSAVRGAALRVHVPLPVRSRILHLRQAAMWRGQELRTRRRYWRIALWVVSESNGSVQFLFAFFCLSLRNEYLKFVSCLCFQCRPLWGKPFSFHFNFPWFSTVTCAILRSLHFSFDAWRKLEPDETLANR